MNKPKDTNCLLKAMELMSPKYSSLLAILPLIFLIVELIKVIYELWFPKDYASAYYSIRNWRIVLSSLTAFFFLLFIVGGVVNYSGGEAMLKRMSVWWIVEGIAGFGSFLTLAIFQYKDFPAGGDIYESIWFWFGMIWFVSFICWGILTKGKLTLPDDNLWLTIKIIGFIIVVFWLGYRPASTKYENASFVILVVMVILAYLFASRQYKVKDSNKYYWYTAISVWFALPVVLIFFSFWKSGTNDDKTLGYIYFTAILISILAYITEIGAYYFRGFKLIQSEEEYNQIEDSDNSV